jgi:secreted trypsin-like serine protease
MLQGDDGGPIIVNGVQVGISSFYKAKVPSGTTPICERGTMFTRVSEFVRSGWIKENLLDPIDIITK